VKPAHFLTAALTLGLAYVVVTPPFGVPDENAHYWRGLALAKGVVLAPAERPAQLVVPHTHLAFLFYLTRDDPRESMRERVKVARAMTVIPHDVRTITYPAFYTPLPYIAPALVAAPSLWLATRPYATFYAARAANLLLALMLIALAMRVAPAAATLIASIALLPMSLFLFASWSADAVTIALSVLLTALILRALTSTAAMSRREAVALTLTALAVSLCKTPYFLIAFAVVTVPLTRFRSSRHKLIVVASVIVAAILGTLTALAYARLGYFNIRAELPVDPAAQLRCIIGEPLRFARILAADLVSNARYYAESLVGRLGWNDIKLSRSIIAFELIVLFATALTSPIELRRSVRIVSLAIAAVTVLAIVSSQYLMWSVVCSDSIEGVQGRYFLPIALLALSSLSLPRPPVRIPPAAVIAAAAISNAIALVTLARAIH